MRCPRVASLHHDTELVTVDLETEPLPRELPAVFRPDSATCADCPPDVLCAGRDAFANPCDWPESGSAGEDVPA